MMLFKAVRGVANASLGEAYQSHTHVIRIIWIHVAACSKCHGPRTVTGGKKTANQVRPNMNYPQYPFPPYYDYV